MLEKVSCLEMEKDRAQLEASEKMELAHKLDEQYKLEIIFLVKALKEKDKTIYQYCEQLETTAEYIKALLSKIEWYKLQSGQDASFVGEQGGHCICGINDQI